MLTSAREQHHNDPEANETPMPSDNSPALAALLDILNLETLELNLFRGRSPQDGWQRVYGGQVIGQAFVAASRTVDSDRIAHSLHAYFMMAAAEALWNT